MRRQRRTVVVGRDAQIGRVTDLLDDGAPLVTLVGPGGIGKTTIATAVAHARGGLFVEGTGTRSAEDTGIAVLAAMGLAADGAAVFGAGWALRAEGTALLVIDNLEQALPDAAGALAALLDAAPELSILVTSRTPVGLALEVVVDVPPLSSSDALALLTAASERAGHEIGVGEREDAALVVERLAGLPLAIQIAAAQMRTLGVAGLARALAEDATHELRAPVGIAVPRRHASVDAAVQWSLDLVENAARDAFAAGAACATEITPDALAHLLDVDDHEARRRAALLADASLWRPSSAGWSMLAPVKAVARRRLAEHGSATRTRERHAAWFTDPERVAHAPLAELQAIVRAAAEHRTPALVDAGLDAVFALPVTLDASRTGVGSLDDAVRALVDTMSERSESKAARVAAARAWLASRAWARGDHATALALAAAALAAPALASADDTATRERAVLVTARASFGRGALDDALAAAARLNDATATARAAAMQVRGAVLQSMGRADDAHAALLTARDLAREAGAVDIEAHVEASLGTLALDAGRLAEAAERLGGARAIALRHYLSRIASVAAAYAGLAMFELGRLADAEALLDEAAFEARRQGNLLNAAVVDVYRAVVAAAQGASPTPPRCARAAEPRCWTRGLGRRSRASAPVTSTARAPATPTPAATRPRQSGSARLRGGASRTRAPTPLSRTTYASSRAALPMRSSGRAPSPRPAGAARSSSPPTARGSPSTAAPVSSSRAGASCARCCAPSSNARPPPRP